MVSNKCTVCPSEYDDSIMSQYICIQFTCRGNLEQKLEWGCCKLVATGQVSDNVFQLSRDNKVF